MRKPRRLLAPLLASPLWLGPGCDEVTVEISPALEEHDHALGVGLSEDFSLAVVTCPFRIDEPECSSQKPASYDLRLHSPVARLDSPAGDAEFHDFRLTGLETGSASLEVDVAGGPSARLQLTVLPARSSHVFPSLWWYLEPLSLDDRAVALVDSEVVIKQRHYRVERPDLASGELYPARSWLLGHAPLQISSESDSAALEPLGFDGTEILHTGSEVGKVRLSTSAGGSLDVTIIHPDDVAALELGEKIENTLVDEIDLSTRKTIFLAPRTAQGELVLGSGGPLPELAASSDVVKVEPVEPDSFLGMHAFLLIPNRSGSTEVVVRWAGHVATLAVNVP